PYLDKWANSRGAIAVEGSTEVKLWPEVFRDAGYDTFLTGKWHNNYYSALKGFSQAKDLIDDPKHAAVNKKLIAALKSKRGKLGDGLLSASLKK
ncbi:MAG: hypothetical protein VCA36_00780, partial [Opitutales bacterium]